MTINCIIIDDEPLARKGLREYIADVDFLHLSGEFEQPLRALDILATGDIQLIFLDIHMPKISGLEFFRSLKNPPPVIFTTAYPQYALDGFEVNALDYLVKPVSFDRFMKAVLKARDFYEWKEAAGRTSAGSGQEADYFFIKADNKLVRIMLEEILFAEALQNYVTIHTTGGKYITYLTFMGLEAYLPSDRFLKTHKSYIVAAAKIDSIEGNDIRIGDRHIPISRSMKDAVMEKLLRGKFLKR